MAVADAISVMQALPRYSQLRQQLFDAQALLSSFEADTLASLLKSARASFSQPERTND